MPVGVIDGGRDGWDTGDMGCDTGGQRKKGTCGASWIIFASTGRWIRDARFGWIAWGDAVKARWMAGHDPVELVLISMQRVGDR